MQKQETRGPRPIQELIRSFIREEGLGQQGRSERVFRAWNDALGDDMRATARPVRFRGRELSVEVSSSAALYELRNFTGEDYRKAVNEKLGNEAIRRVVFRLRT